MTKKQEAKLKAVKSMEYLVRNVNNEELIFRWLEAGVADGDIEYGDLDVTSEDLDNLEYYIEADTFKDLQDIFLFIMKQAYKDGGLYF